MLGCQRSGTTLTARILAAHPQAAFGSELGVIRFAMIWFRSQCQSRAAFRNLRMVEFLHAFQRVGGPQGPAPQQRIYRAVEQVLLRYLRDGRLERWADACDVDTFVRNLCFDAHAVGVRAAVCWGDKYPEHLFLIDEIEAVFPASRYIFVHRHPHDVMESLFRHRNTRRAFTGGLRFTMADCRDQWVEWNSIWLETRERIDAGRRFELRFEDLARDADAALSKLSDFAGCALLDSPQVRELAARIDPAQVGKWRSMTDAHLVESCETSPGFEQVRAALGYDPAIGAPVARAAAPLPAVQREVSRPAETQPSRAEASAAPADDPPLPPPPAALCASPPTADAADEPLPPPPPALFESTAPGAGSGNRSHPRVKLLVIGLDGMTPNLLFEELARLGNFKTLIEGGVHGELASVSPPMSGCAWPSFFTGLEPRGHGFDENQRRFEDMSYADVRVPKLWDFLNRSGISTGFLNMPLAYPMGPMRGYIVPGRFAPLKRMSPQVRDTLQGYRAHPRIAPQTTPEFLREQWETDRQCVHYWEKLIRAHPTDLATIVLYTPDNVGHWFWDDPAALHDSYGLLDRLVGQILNSVEADHVLIMSDHGMCGKEEPGTEEFCKVLSDKGEKVHFAMQGWHQKDGIYIASGAGFQPHSERRPLGIIDLTPIMLRLFGVELPETTRFDGAAPDWLFSDAPVGAFSE